MTQDEARKKRAEEYADSLMMTPNDAYREGITEAHIAGKKVRIIIELEGE